MCMFYMHFQLENALQSNMVIVFLPKWFPLHAVIWRYHYEHALSLWARAFFSYESYRKKINLYQKREQFFFSIYFLLSLALLAIAQCFVDYKLI